MPTDSGTLDPIREARFAAPGAAPCRHHELEQPLLRGRLGERLVDALGEFIEHARHREHQRGALARKVFGKLRNRAGISDLRADRERQVVAASALEHVRKRKQGKEHVVASRQLQALAGGDVGENVAVREHHALGPARSAGGVANRGEGVVCERRGFELRRLSRKHRFDPVAAAARIGCEAENARKRGAHLGQSVRHATALHDEQAGAAILQAPGDVFRIVVHVERHDDQAEPERTLVGRDPVDAVFQAQSNALALREVFGPQKRLPARRVSGDLARGDIAPPAFDEVTVEISLGRSELCLEKACDVGHVSAVLGSGPVDEVHRSIMLNPP